MTGKRAEYQVVGRYMNGKEVEGYHIQSLESGRSMKINKNQMAYLVGRGQITNCEGQLYKDKVLYRGVGISLDDLPVKQLDGGLSRTDAVGHIRRGDTAEDAMTKLMIIGSVARGRIVESYIVKNAGGATATLPKKEIVDLARQGKIGNARVQMYNGTELLRGVGVNLNELPCKRLDINMEDKSANNKDTHQDSNKSPEERAEEKAVRLANMIESAMNQVQRRKITDFSVAKTGYSEYCRVVKFNMSRLLAKFEVEIRILWTDENYITASIDMFKIDDEYTASHSIENITCDLVPSDLNKSAMIIADKVFNEAKSIYNLYSNDYAIAKGNTM